MSAFRHRFDRGFEALRNTVGLGAQAAVHHRYAVLALMLLFLLGSVGLLAGGHVRLEAMPEIDGDVLEARILLPQGTPLAQTKAVTDRMVAAMQRLGEQHAADQPYAQALVRHIQVRFNQHGGTREQGAHVATVMVDLLTAERRSVDLASLAARWRSEIGDIPGLIALHIQEPGFGPAGIPVEIRLQGDDLDRLKHAADALSAELNTYAGALNVLDDLRPGKPQRILRLRDTALALGLNAEQIAAQLRTNVLGAVISTVQLDDQHIEILLRQEARERSTRDFLRNAVIADQHGQMIPLVISLVFGLLVSTVLILLVLPALYTILADL